MKINFEQPSNSSNDQLTTQEGSEAKDRENLDSLMERAEKTEAVIETSKQANEEGEARENSGVTCGTGHGCMGSHYCSMY